MSGEDGVDPRVVGGMEKQHAARESEAGERPPIGWKLGFGTSAALERFSLSEPLVGYLTSATRVHGGTPVDLSELRNPKLEPELSVTLRDDLAPDAGDQEVRAAIASVAPAFELVDLDADEEDVERILAGDIFHRAFALGADGPTELLDSPSLRLTDPAGEDHELDAFAATGEPLGLLRTVARTLAASGRTFSAGELAICGSIIPPLDPKPGESYKLALEGAGVAEISFAE